MHFDHVFTSYPLLIGPKNTTMETSAVKAKPRSHLKLNKEVSEKILGIPIRYQDFEYKNLTLSIEKFISDESRFISDKNQTSFAISIPFDVEFTLFRVTEDFYSFLDVVSTLGGIGATIQMAIETAAPVFIVLFMIAFAK